MIEINMQMPENCGLCPCFHFENPMYCQAVKADKNKKIVAPYSAPRPEWCPLKEKEDVKPIKKDAVEITARYKFDCPCGAPLLIGQPYCADCGRAVKWE